MTVLETAAPSLDRAFTLAAGRAETLVGELLGGGDVSEAVRLSAAALGAGLRAPARTVLRSLTVSGQAAEPVNLVSALAARYASWTGDAGFPGTRRGDPRVFPEPEMACSEEAALAPLLEAADRVLAAGNGARAADVRAVLEGVILGLWRVEPDAPVGALGVAPRLPEDWPAMAIRRLRVGSTAMEISVRRRAGLAVRVRRSAGPRLFLTVEPRPFRSGSVWLDDVELRGSRARFELADHHDLVFPLSP